MTIQEAIEWQEAFKRTYNGIPEEVNEACDFVISALKEIEQFREIGTIDELKELDYLRKRYEDETYDYCGEYGTEECGCKFELHRFKKYEEIGTVDECRIAREKMKPKKPTHIDYDYGYFECPSCGELIYDSSGEFITHHFCLNCGQAILWESD